MVPDTEEMLTSVVIVSMSPWAIVRSMTGPRSLVLFVFVSPVLTIEPGTEKSSKDVC